MLKTKARRSAAGDDEPAEVDGAVVRRAEHDEMIDVVTAAVRAQLEVVHVDKNRVPAPRDDAAALVPAEDVTAERWRDGLGGADDSRLWLTHVGARCRASRRIGARY